MKALLLIFAFAIAFAPTAEPQAYCALRDPNRQIFELFPEADSYRSIVRTIDEETRSAMLDELPFTLHFNELGRHTLYVANKDGEALGLVHLRSEAGTWGLVEVAWALDLDLRVTGFAFQRCREPGSAEVESAAVRNALRGKGLDELRPLLSEDGSRLARRALPFEGAAADRGLVVVRNALKTVSVTALAWGDDVVQLRAREAAARLGSLGKLAPVELYDHVDLEELASKLGAESVGVLRAEVRAWDALGPKGAPLGRVILTPWEHAGERIDVWWTLDTEHRVRAVESRAGWPLEEMAPVFRSLVGKTEPDLCGCSGPVELLGHEVLFVSTHASAQTSDR